MAFLSGFNVSITKVDLLGRASIAAFAGAPVPSGWTVVTPAQLKLGSKYRDGNYYTDGDGASAIVLRKGNEYIVSFRGTDDARDVENYPELYFGDYIDHFRPLLDALKAQAPAGSKFSFTGASLGGGAVNNLAAIAKSDFGGTFKNATFVAFASPNITNANGILNLGAENDPVYKSVPNPIWAPQFQDYASSADNIVIANDAYVAGNGGQDSSAHNELRYLTAFERLAKSSYVDEMKLDSVIVFAESNGVVQDKGAGRSNTGAYYIGRDNAGDRMSGRNGNDTLEGFGGNDKLNGGRGDDRIKGGAGNDTLDGGAGNDALNGGAGKDVVKGGDGDDVIGISGSQAKSDTMSGGSGTDTLKASGKTVTLSGFSAAESSIEKFKGDNTTVLGDSSVNIFDFRKLTSVTGLEAIDGGKGNDKVYGSRFADNLRGGDGADVLLGYNGNDILSGGRGGNTFVFNPNFGHDRITDFTVSGAEQDVIRFHKSVFANFAEVIDHATQKGSAVVITVDTNNSLTLDGVSLAALSANDFTFA
jgi:Ca2+-binding RTX toxin-like protein